MIATEVYKIIRSVVGPWFKENGFKVAKDYLTYRKPVGGRHFVVRFQCHHQGWEKHKGSKFTVFADVVDDPDEDWTQLRRLTQYLGFEQLEFIRARQNRILAAIPQPPADYIKQMVVGFERTFRDAKPYIDIYLGDWKPVTQPYNSNDDVWFRYFTEEDVRAWAILLLNHVEKVYREEAT